MSESTEKSFDELVDDVGADPAPDGRGRSLHDQLSIYAALPAQWLVVRFFNWTMDQSILRRLDPDRFEIITPDSVSEREAGELESLLWTLPCTFYLGVFLWMHPVLNPAAFDTWSIVNNIAVLLAGAVAILSTRRAGKLTVEVTHQDDRLEEVDGR
ncbi:hypothetical protein [Natrinema sp. DC36]|uniref:hypothetical protein n=1 Tax=Natrinema sp. DC36 TaxID=2878680 RepID=UPI001CF0505E|nr:hypothetical protein [Natrinema sp. DC36]